MDEEPKELELGSSLIPQEYEQFVCFKKEF